MKYYLMLNGKLSLWHAENSTCIAEFVPEGKSDAQKLMAAGKNDTEAMVSLIRSIVDVNKGGRVQ